MPRTKLHDLALSIENLKSVKLTNFPDAKEKAVKVNVELMRVLTDFENRIKELEKLYPNVRAL